MISRPPPRRCQSGSTTHSLERTHPDREHSMLNHVPCQAAARIPVIGCHDASSLAHPQATD